MSRCHRANEFRVRRDIFWRDDTDLNKRNNSDNSDTMNIKKKTDNVTR